MMRETRSIERLTAPSSSINVVRHKSSTSLFLMKGWQIINFENYNWSVYLVLLVPHGAYIRACSFFVLSPIFVTSCTIQTVLLILRLLLCTGASLVWCTDAEYWRLLFQQCLLFTVCGFLVFKACRVLTKSVYWQVLLAHLLLIFNWYHLFFSFDLYKFEVLYFLFNSNACWLLKKIYV